MVDREKENEEENGNQRRRVTGRGGEGDNGVKIGGKEPKEDSKVRGREKAIKNEKKWENKAEEKQMGKN